MDNRLEQWFKEDIVDKNIISARTAYFLGYNRAQIELKEKELHECERKLAELRQTYSNEGLDTAPIGGFHDW